MVYEFDKVLDRRNTNCEKWDNLKEVFGRDDVVPLWVADMDLASPPEVVEALRWARELLSRCSLTASDVAITAAYRQRVKDHAAHALPVGRLDQHGDLHALGLQLAHDAPDQLQVLPCLADCL